MTVVVVRKRAVEAEAILYTGQNGADVVAFAGDNAYMAGSDLIIITDRGDAVADAGDWVIRGLVGEYYPCTAEAFDAGWEFVRRAS